ACQSISPRRKSKRSSTILEESMLGMGYNYGDIEERMEKGDQPWDISIRKDSNSLAVSGSRKAAEEAR
ncbi:hypothetical protein SARC_13642, partial [Sphaeroforma arctica JP610]